jgi:hypothetical protein
MSAAMYLRRDCDSLASKRCLDAQMPANFRGTTPGS